MDADIRKILVLGASGLIGRFVTDDLRARGFHVVGVARQFARLAEEQRARSRAAGHVDGCSRAGAAARATIASMSSSIASACCRTAPAATPRRASRFRRAAAAGDPRQRPRDPAGAHLDSRRRRDRPHRLQHHQARGRAVDRGLRRSVTRSCGRALWWRRAAYGGSAMLRALAAFPLDLPAGGIGRAVPAGRDRGYCGDHRLARRRAISLTRRRTP